MPVSITPSAFGPTTRAADLNSTSTDGLWRFTGSPSLHARDVVGAAALDAQVQAARRDVGVAGQHALAVARFLRRGCGTGRRAAPRSCFVKPGGMCCVISTAGRVGRQADQHFLGRLGAAGGGADEDDLLGRQAARARRPAPAARPRARRRRPAAAAAGRRSCALAAMRILSVMSSASWLQAVGHADLRLGDEVDRAELQRAQRHVGAALGQRGDHHDRHRPQPHQLAEEVDAVHARHLDVERDHVGVQRCGSSRAPPAGRSPRRRTPCRAGG